MSTHTLYHKGIKGAALRRPSRIHITSLVHLFYPGPDVLLPVRSERPSPALRRPGPPMQPAAGRLNTAGVFRRPMTDGRPHNLSAATAAYQRVICPEAVRVSAVRPA